MWGHLLEHGRPTRSHILKKKPDSPSNIRHQLSIALQLEVWIHECLHPCWNGLILCRLFTGNHNCCVFMWNSSVMFRVAVLLLLLQSFIPIIRDGPWALAKESDTNVSFVSEHSTITESLHLDQFWGFVFTTTHHIKKLLWWNLRAALTMSREIKILREVWYTHFAK